MIWQSPSETFSDLYQDVCCIYDVSKFEEEGRYGTHKDCQDYRQAGRDICIKDFLTLIIWMTNSGQNLEVEG